MVLVFYPVGMRGMQSGKGMDRGRLSDLPQDDWVEGGSDGAVRMGVDRPIDAVRHDLRLDE